MLYCYNVLNLDSRMLTVLLNTNNVKMYSQCIYQMYNEMYLM